MTFPSQIRHHPPVPTRQAWFFVRDGLFGSPRTLLQLTSGALQRITLHNLAAKPGLQNRVNWGLSNVARFLRPNILAGLRLPREYARPIRQWQKPGNPVDLPCRSGKDKAFARAAHQ